MKFNAVILSYLNNKVKHFALFLQKKNRFLQHPPLAGQSLE